MILPLEYEGFYRKYNESTCDGIHNGWDLRAPEGTKTFAISDGIVLLSSEIHGFGGLNPPIPGVVILPGCLFLVKDAAWKYPGHLLSFLFVFMEGKQMTDFVGLRDFVKNLKVLQNS